MCIAILNKGNTVSKKHLKNSWDSNFNGAGLMWVQGGALHTYKKANKHKSTDFTEFYDTYLQAYSNRDENTPVGIHFRIATHGKTDEFLHPFKVGENIGLMHNGILSGLGTEAYSDTAKLADLLSGLPEVMLQNVDELLSNNFIYTALASMCGAGNKLIFIDNTGDYEIVNEKAGHWADDNWYSNDSYKNSGVRYYGDKAVYDWGKGWGKAWEKPYTASTPTLGASVGKPLPALPKATTPFVDADVDESIIDAADTKSLGTFWCGKCYSTEYVTDACECERCGTYQYRAETAVCGLLYS